MHTRTVSNRLSARGTRRVKTIAIAAAIAGAGAALPATASAADVTAPWVSVTAPVAGSTVSGTVNLTANATDSVGVAAVKWYIDGKEVAFDATAPYSASWNSGSVSAGSHRIFAKARDAAYNWGTSKEVTFTVGSAAASKWQLVMSDDFNGTAVDATKWDTWGPNIPGHNGNGLRDFRALNVSNGLFTITARMINGTLVSGGMESYINQTYGRFEFRVRVDKDPYNVTSGVVLTWPQSRNWPIDGENNIYENTWQEGDRTPVKSFIHYGADNKQYWFHHKNPDGTGVDGSVWHTYAMEWERTAIRIYRDGALVWTVTDQNAIPDVPHHLSMHLDAFKSYMSNTVRMQVDWVRIYKKV